MTRATMDAHSTRVVVEEGSVSRVDGEPFGEQGVEPWFRARPLAALLVAGVLFLGILALRLSTDGSREAVSMLYVLPVSLVAMARGRRAGALAGVVAAALILVWALASDTDLGFLGWVSRVVPLLLVGVLVGDARDRLERAAADREARRLAQMRHREAVEINDSLVQGMTAAKWSLEGGRVEEGVRLLGETIEQGHRLVSKLIRESGEDRQRSWSLRDEDPDA